MKTMRLLQIRAYRSDDLDAVIETFLAAIRLTASKDYTPGQIMAWAQVDRRGWASARLSHPTWVATLNSSVIGFTDLEHDGHLDMMFVHPHHQGQGVATALYDTVETAARAQDLARIFTEASITARPFFQKRGFAVIAAQVVDKRGQNLRNYRMDKLLT